MFSDHCDSKWGMLRPLRPKPCILRPLRLIVGMLRLCATQNICATLRDPKQMLRLCATQIRYVATIATQSGYVATLCDQNFCATLRDPKTDAILRDPKEICCDFARPKNRCVATSRVEVCDLCFDRLDQKNGIFQPSRSVLGMFRPTRPQAVYVSTMFEKKNNSTVFDRGKNVTTEFDRGVFFD